MAPDIVVKRRDTWPPLKAKLEETIGAGPGKQAINLSTAVKVLFIMKTGSAAAIEGACKIIAGNGGEVEFDWTTVAGSTAAQGLYNVEFEIEWSSTHFETVPNSGYREVELFADLGGH